MGLGQQLQGSILTGQEGKELLEERLGVEERVPAGLWNHWKCLVKFLAGQGA